MVAADQARHACQRAERADQQVAQLAVLAGVVDLEIEQVDALLQGQPADIVQRPGQGQLPALRFGQPQLAGQAESDVGHPPVMVGQQRADHIHRL